MRYGVIGTGAIGGYYGAKLARAGQEVHFLLRSDYEYVKQHGLQVDSCDGSFHLTDVNAYLYAEDMPTCDVVLVCLKSVNNSKLQTLLPPLLHTRTLVVLIQNGIGVEEDVQKMLPDAQLAAGLAFICSAKTKPGLVSHQCYGSINLANFSCRDETLMQSVVELTAVTVSGDDLRFTAKTTLSKDGQVTATYGPRQEHFTRAEADYTETVLGLWEITFTSDNPEYESSVPYRELYRNDGTASFYDLIDGQWVEEETVLSEYFADGPLFCFRWQKPGKELRRENWEIISCENGKMVNKAFLRHADGTTYTITAHLTKVLEKV